MDRVKALWEASHVRRFHTRVLIQHYDVGQHTYRMLMLAHLLHPRPTLRLLRAITFHDSAERWTGDVPATAKWKYPELDEALVDAETHIQRKLCVSVPMSRKDEYWLKALDCLELYLFCWDEVTLGNSTLHEPASALQRILAEDWVPAPVRKYLDNNQWQQQGDTL